MKRINRITWIIVIVMFVIAVISFAFMPDQIPIQWGFDGVSRMGSKWMIFMFGLLGALCASLKKSQEQENKQKSIVYFLAIIVLLIAELVTVVLALV